MAFILLLTSAMLYATSSFYFHQSIDRLFIRIIKTDLNKGIRLFREQLLCQMWRFPEFPSRYA